MNSKMLLLSVLLFTWTSAATQTGSGKNGAVSGRIIDSQTQEGIEGAYVFFSHTTKGTQTNKHGYFAISQAPAGMAVLVIAKAGYDTKIQQYDPDSDERNVEINLLKTIDANNDRMWTAEEQIQREYFIEKFTHIFLGASKTGNGLCEIKNEQALDFFFNEQTNVMEAYAHEPLIIENRLTGYRIVFVLENFTCFSLEGKIRYSYKGRAFFVEMIPQLEGSLWDWQKNRYLTYRGSLPHFLATLSKNELAEEGYTISLDVFSPETNTMKEYEIDIDVNKIFRAYENANRFLLKFPDFLRVDFFNGDSKATSWLYLNKQYAIFDNTGRFIRPFNPTTLHGYWANRSLSLLLPSDYIPKQPETLGYNK